MTKKILLALPAFNEEKNISTLLKSTLEHNLDVLLVDDGSTDNTVAIASEFRIKIISHNKNQGLSEVYKTFITYAVSQNYTHIITFDSDGQHDPSFIGKFVKMLETNDVVLGNRFFKPESIPQEKLSSNYFASKLAESVFGEFLPDISCGFRAFKVDFLKSVVVESNEFEIIYQVVFGCLKRNIKPAYIQMKPNYYGQPMETKISEILSLLNQIFIYSENISFSDLSNNIALSLSFDVEIMNVNFNFNLSGKLAYVINTDRNNALMYYHLNR